jgi:hypothetical protein
MQKRMRREELRCLILWMRKNGHSDTDIVNLLLYMNTEQK